MRNPRALLRSAVLLLCTFQPAAGQQGVADGTSPRLNIYVDCQTRCEMDYLRTEISFVEFMRDRQDAEVHVLITGRQTGAGGTEYTLQFVGRERFDGVSDELIYATIPNATQDQVREGMARLLKAGLVRYAARTPMFERLELSFADSAGTGTSAQRGDTARDPWNAWVFRTRFGGFFNGEASYSNRNLDGSISATRVTLGWRTTLSLNARQSRNEFEVGDRTVVNLQNNRSLTSQAVKSVTDHWSAGTRVNFDQSTFLNRDLAARAAPAVEFNFFPYSESTRRELTVQYSIGVNHVDYQRETIYGKMSEALADHTLNVSYEMRQRWGNVRTSIEGSQYFHDWDKYHLRASGGIDLRIFRGIALNFNGNADRIHDQLHLAKGSLTDEEILLRQRQIETSYRYFFSVGLSYSFGSIYNSVVNPRMGGGGGGGGPIFF